jgi:hypothetical protein
MELSYVPSLKIYISLHERSPLIYDTMLTNMIWQPSLGKAVDTITSSVFFTMLKFMLDGVISVEASPYSGQLEMMFLL